MKTSDLTPTVQLLRDLVAIPSVNPAFLPKGDPRAGEGRVAELLAERAHRIGLEAEWGEVFPGRSNLILRLRPSEGPKARVMLAPHLDTVGVPDDRLLEPRMAQSRLYGRGACDTKGSVAAMFTALAQVAQSSARPKSTEIVFAGLMDEENEQSGSRALVKQGWRANLAVVGEPTNLEVVLAHKGNVWLELETHGRAAHGAQPHLGRNAVLEMARIVDLLETEYAAELRLREHPLLGNPTVNVGRIEGGAQTNIVPDRCRAQVDRRYLPGETESTIRREIRQLLDRHQLHARIRNLKGVLCWPLETNEALPLVQQFQKAVRRQRVAGADFFCDAGVLDRGGIPSLVFGPGKTAQAHTATEWVSVKAVDRAMELLKRFLYTLP